VRQTGAVSGGVENPLQIFDELCPTRLEGLDSRIPDGAGGGGAEGVHHREDQEETHDDEHDAHDPVSQMLDANRRNSDDQKEHDTDEQHPSEAEVHDPRRGTCAS